MYLDELAEEIYTEAEGLEGIPEDYMLLYRMYALLALSVGPWVTSIQVHAAWAVWVSESDIEHESNKPWGDLAPSVQLLSHPYVEAIYKVAKRRGLGLDNG